MTDMKHKSADQRRMRRQRYKNACKPMMALFGCTSMEVAGHISSVVTENKSLKVQLADAKAKFIEQHDKLKELELENESRLKHIKLVEAKLADAEEHVKKIVNEEGE